MDDASAKDHPFKAADIAALFEAYPQPQRDCLLSLRAMIFEIAQGDSEVGAIVEQIKWGQPSYTTRPLSGTPLRLGLVKGKEEHIAFFVHCQTSLIETMRHHYGDSLCYDGSRAVHLSIRQPLPKEALTHLISLALRYKL